LRGARAAEGQDRHGGRGSMPGVHERFSGGVTSVYPPV
jgi:hypothetical protein